MKEFTLPQEWLSSFHFGKPLAVLVMGAGGTGSEVMDQLLRLHLTLRALGNPGLHVTLADGDTVSEFNVGRQRFWPYDIGRNKAEVIVSRFQQFAGVDWGFVPDNLSPQEVIEDLPDLLITCIDSGRLRWDISEYTLECLANSQDSVDHPMFWLDCGNGQVDGQVIFGHLIQGLDCPFRLPNIVDLYPSLEHAEDKDEDSCSHAQAIQKQDFGINLHVASAATNLIWRLIRHGKIEHHGAFVDVKAGITQPLPIDEKQWALFGYTP